MNTHYTYLFVDLACLIFPLFFSFFPAFQFRKMWGAFFPAMGITTLFFVLWDAFFTHLGVWSFNSDYTLSTRIMGLPLEEILFFFCIPYACVFTYYCVKRYAVLPISEKTIRYGGLVLIFTVGISALLHTEKLYTSVTFGLLAFLLLFLILKKEKYLSPFFTTFLLILPLFFLSNGILTGSFIDEPVVLYNPEHNLGIRMFTIPFEDTFYGMLLLLMNVSLYEHFGKRLKS